MKSYLYSVYSLLISTLLLIMGGSLLTSCDDDESYTTSTSARLSFSADTIRFDTVFTTLGSSTKIFKVYNNNSESLLIPSIRLAGNENTGFRVNVDGMPGTSFTDVEVRKKDSIYIFVEVTVDPKDEDNPFLLRDSLIFNLASGVEQRVQLEAYGQDMIVFRGTAFHKDTTLNGARPYVIYDSLRVEPDVTLRLLEGTRLFFHNEASFHIYGTLKAEGTLTHPVIFRGDRLDKLFPYLPYDRLDKQWGGVFIHSSSYDNELNYVDIHSGNYGIICDSSDVDKTKLTIENSVIHNVAFDALSTINCRIWVGNSQITNAGGHCVNIRGGHVQFIYSTLANFYPWGFRGAAVALNNVNCNLERADFLNCIITGSSSNELMKIKDKEESIPFNYYIANSLLNVPGDSIKGDNYHNIKCDSVGSEISRIENFPLIDRNIYYYDFTLDSLSQAIGIGNAEEAEMYYPFDRLGQNRLVNGNPDAGAYQYVKKDEEE